MIDMKHRLNNKAVDWLIQKGGGVSPYGEILWNYETANNEWLSDILEEYYQYRVAQESLIKNENK
jgi:hypothetical protein